MCRIEDCCHAITHEAGEETARSTTRVTCQESGFTLLRRAKSLYQNDIFPLPSATCVKYIGFVQNQCYGRAVHFWSFFCCGSESLARVTPCCSCAVLGFDGYFHFEVRLRNGTVWYAAPRISPEVCSSMRNRVTRASGSNPVVKKEYLALP